MRSAMASIAAAICGSCAATAAGTVASSRVHDPGDLQGGQPVDLGQFGPERLGGQRLQLGAGVTRSWQEASAVGGHGVRLFRTSGATAAAAAGVSGCRCGPGGGWSAGGPGTGASGAVVPRLRGVWRWASASYEAASAGAAVSYVRCATPMNRQSTTRSWLVRRRHGGRAQLALAGGGGGQDVVGVLRDGPVRAAGDRDRRGAVLEGDPQRLDDVAGRAGVGDRDGDVPGAQLHGVGDGEVRVAVGVRDQADAQQLLGEVLGDEAGGADAVDVDAAGGRRARRRRRRAGPCRARRRCRRGSAARRRRVWRRRRRSGRRPLCRR